MSSKPNRSNKSEEQDNQYKVKALHINRCSKVVKGGRKFSFSALILVGDGQGRVGYGFAKANELTNALEKAEQLAKKNVITVKLAGTTVPHEVNIRCDGSTVMLKPAKPGTGIVAGSRCRVILEMLGVKDVVAKNIGSSNAMNQVRATFTALESFVLRSEYVQEKRTGGAA
jgi:small subunit ribosomal protein S5